jgi:putative selenium metabolism hydrolase
MLTNTQHAQVIDLCRDLVRAPSLAGREANAAAQAERWMRLLGYDEVFVDEYGSVVGTIRGLAGDEPRLHFDGHLDTVPATARDDWIHDPFAAELVDGRIYGRGATDMKGPLAAMICAAAFAPRERLRGTLTVSASVGEEELEGPALNHILHARPADMVIIGESTLLAAGIGQKGRAGIRITTTGRPAHSSVPQQGDNAVYRMLEATARLRAVTPPEDALLGPGIMELVEIVSSPFPGTSIVPDRCTVRWDRRLVRGETRESVLAGVRAALAGLAKVEAGYLDVTMPCYTGATLRSDDFHPAWEIAPSHPLTQAALASAAAAGLKARTCPVAYCTNGSGSAGERGIPSLVIGPGDPALLHVVDEHITVEQLALGVAVYMGMIARLVGSV